MDRFGWNLEHEGRVHAPRHTHRRPAEDRGPGDRTRWTGQSSVPEMSPLAERVVNLV